MKYVGENALKKWTSLVKSDIKKKLDKNQGTANSGKILGVNATGEVAPTDTEVATLVDVPNGIVKGDGSTLSAAVAGTDYMAPVTGGTTGQVLTKTASGQEWADAPQTVTIPETTALLKGDGVGGVAAVTTDATPTQGSTNPVQSGGVYSALANKLDKPANDATATAGQLLTKTANGHEWKNREKDVLVVNMTMNDDGSISSADKTFDEVYAAYNTGKTVIADLYSSPLDAYYIFPSVAFKIDEGIMFAAVNGINSTVIAMSPTDIVTQDITIQDRIIAKGILKGDGSGGISSAVAGTDYVAPDGNGSNVTAAFTAASTRANITTGEKLSVLFGKIAKWFADLGSLAFKDTVAKTDLASDVQTSLRKADTALQRVNKIDIDLGNVENERQYSSANPPPYPVTSVNGKTGAVTVETSSGTTYNATLSSSGWTTSGSYKKQTVTVTGLKANYPVAPVVDVQLTGTDADGDTAVLTGFSAINLIQTAANQLIAYCIGDAPTVNIPLIINTWG